MTVGVLTSGFLQRAPYSLFELIGDMIRAHPPPGILHAVFIITIEYTLASEIERVAGWLRTAIVYFISGTGGFLMSAILVPYQVSVGSSPATYGLLAALVCTMHTVTMVIVVIMVFSIESCMTRTHMFITVCRALPVVACM